MTNYFYDSYAIIEYIRGNKKYQTYFETHKGITTLYNIMEVYYCLLREQGEKKAKHIIEVLKQILIHPSFEDIEPAMNFRFKHKERKFSYADCLGYYLAKKNKIRFLTGDKGFKHIPHVEFVN